MTNILHVHRASLAVIFNHWKHVKLVSPASTITENVKTKAHIEKEPWSIIRRARDACVYELLCACKSKKDRNANYFPCLIMLTVLPSQEIKSITLPTTFNVSIYSVLFLLHPLVLFSLSPLP